MKKKFVRMICLVLAVMLVCFTVVSCGSNQTSGGGGGGGSQPAGGGGGGGGSQPAGGGGGGGGGDAAPSDKVYHIDAAFAAGESTTRSWAGILKEMEERSGGRLQSTIHLAGSLLTFPEIPRGMQSGVAQWAYLPTVNYVDIFPLSCRIMQLPFMGLEDPIVACEIFMQLFDEFPEMAQEYEPFNMIPIAASPLWGYFLHLIDDSKEVRVPSDLAGKTIVPYKTELIPMLSKYNAAGSYIPPGQMYESLERSVIDGYVNCWAFAQWFVLHEFLKQHVLIGENGMFQEFFVYVVAKDFYESLPADLQQLWFDVFRNQPIENFNNEPGYVYMWRETESFTNWQMQFAKDNNHLIVQLTPDEIQIWKDELADVHEVAIAEINAQRKDEVATAIYNRALELIAQKKG